MSLTLEGKPTTFRGTFSRGVVVLKDAVTLPEGTIVDVTLPDTESPSFLRDEFTAWDKAGADAWSRIAQWEAEENCDPETLA